MSCGVAPAGSRAWKDLLLPGLESYACVQRVAGEVQPHQPHSTSCPHKLVENLSGVFWGAPACLLRCRGACTAGSTAGRADGERPSCSGQACPGPVGLACTRWHSSRSCFSAHHHQSMLATGTAPCCSIACQVTQRMQCQRPQAATRSLCTSFKELAQAASPAEQAHQGPMGLMLPACAGGGGRAEGRGALAPAAVPAALAWSKPARPSFWATTRPASACTQCCPSPCPHTPQLWSLAAPATQCSQSCLIPHTRAPAA